MKSEINLNKLPINKELKKKLSTILKEFNSYRVGNEIVKDNKKKGKSFFHKFFFSEYI